MPHTFHILPHIHLTNDFMVRKEVLENLPVPLIFVSTTKEIIWKNRLADWLDLSQDTRKGLLALIGKSRTAKAFASVKLFSGVEVLLQSQPVHSLTGSVEGYLVWASDNLSGLAGDFLETGLAVAENGHFILVNAVARNVLGLETANAHWNAVDWLPPWHVAMRRGHRTLFALTRDEFEIRVHAHYPWVMLEAIPVPIIDNDRISVQFASAMMHEVRNPLSALSGYIELAQMQLPPGPVRDHLDRAMAEVDRLSRMTADFMSLSRSTELHKQWCHIASLVEKAWTIAQAGEKREHTVELHVDLNAQDRVFGDPDRLEQILINALKNAVEAFSGPGIITVSMHRDVDGQHLVIADNGPGMPDEVMETLFVKRRTTKAHGHGLGLLIIKQLAEGHGGVVQVTTEKGQGTAITVTLPYPNDEAILDPG
ncbi:hypothetical protein BXT84_03830 [Sulfobacillus thermotolerans]|uniref:histidine kinase n=1 Tax=Sulfobacillus thermotolerans TaxID=338644 RepID=A0ABM6RPA1_9FIRM|nr:hypothetical protein BXT84_03830 [Sulfobacillus thermotolerans]